MSNPSELPSHPALSPRVRRAICGLGITQIIGYGTTYYLLGLLGPQMLAELGLGKATLLAGASLALLASGFFGPATGRWQDQLGSRRPMVLGPLLMGSGLILIASARDATLYFAGWGLIACGSPLALYSASFTALTHMAGQQARRAIILLTLIAGLASSIVWPLTAWMMTISDWRTIVLLFAAANILVSAPIHFALFDDGQHAPLLTDSEAVQPGLSSSAQKPAFWLLTTMLAVLSTARDAWSMLAIPILVGLGFEFRIAVLVASLIGVFQTVGRFVEYMAGARHSPLRTAEISGTLFVLATLALILSQGSLMLGLIFAAMYGAANGLNTLVKGTLTLQIFGSNGYGERLGKVSLTPLIMAALGPILGGFVIDGWGAQGAAWCFFGCMVGGFAIMLALTFHCRRHGMG